MSKSTSASACKAAKRSWLALSRQARRERRRDAFLKLKSAFMERLEPRVLLTGNPVANNDSYSAPFDSTLQISAPGVLVPRPD